MVGCNDYLPLKLAHVGYTDKLAYAFVDRLLAGDSQNENPVKIEGILDYYCPKLEIHTRIPRTKNINKKTAT